MDTTDGAVAGTQVVDTGGHHDAGGPETLGRILNVVGDRGRRSGFRFSDQPPLADSPCRRPNSSTSHRVGDSGYRIKVLIS